MQPTHSTSQPEMSPGSDSQLLQVVDLHVHFATHAGVVRAVRGASFEIGVGEKVGLVGESGCGKSVTALSIMQLVPRPRGQIADGQIWIHDDDCRTDIAQLKPTGSAIRKMRGREIAMIFQEPMTSLNPSFTVGNQLIEAIRQHIPGINKKAAREKATDALRDVGMPDPRSTLDRYPHQLSGGMRQRVMIAMAIALEPRLLIADEPTTALDVTVQAQILDLMNECLQRYGMSLLWITHDLGLVGELCDRVMVMYRGEIVEDAPVAQIFEEPRHPYTHGLLSSLLIESDFERRDLMSIEGTVPGPFDEIEGCQFAPRCPRAWAQCEQAAPMVEFDDGKVRCWLHDPSVNRGSS